MRFYSCSFTFIYHNR